MSKQYLQTQTLPPDPAAPSADIFSLATTPSHLLVASGHSSIRVHRIRGQTIHADTAEDEHPYPLIQTLEKAHPLGAHHICASPDGKVAASGGFGGEVRVWQLSVDESNGEETWTKRGDILPPKTKKERDASDSGESWALALSENGQYLAASTHDGRLNVYDTTTFSPSNTTPERITQYETKGSFALSVDLSPDGSLTASGHQNGSIYIFSNTTRRLTHSLPGLIKPVRTLKFSPLNRYLAAAGDARIIALYDTQSGGQIANLSGHASWIMSLDWNWSGEFLVSGGYDGKVKIWSVERRECVATQTESEKCLWAVKWLVKGAQARNESFVTAGAGGTLAFYREASGT
ncbi:Ski complex subunit Rec14 [Saxophila tyrrhenica]|uniref:Ski complex subunit Rec14 n=1 Tax=Saxophila tyrrhenica TaxID=1690608 RepID=A0AAV9NWB7_9PEZI|nr:Ski complex subunit Rec14 [Saxophila tyrrhenica]